MRVNFCVDGSDPIEVRDMEHIPRVGEFIFLGHKEYNFRVERVDWVTEMLTSGTPLKSFQVFLDCRKVKNLK